MNILEVKNVSKRFGSKQVLDGLDLSVPTGSIFGFVGGNGTGKTTTMKLILGLEETSKGDIFVGGEKVTFGNTKTNRITGYLSDVPEFYHYMSAEEYLSFCGEITGLTKEKRKQKIQETLRLVGLERNKKKIKGFSRGMKQRLGIAQAMLNDPELLICDEPTSALDPEGRNEFLELLASLKGKMTILFSTHILGDVERICDYVGILHEGKLKVNSSIEELKQTYAKPQIELAFDEEADFTALAAEFHALKKQEIITEVENVNGRNQVIITYNKGYAETAGLLLESFTANKMMPVSLRKMNPSLESIFLEVIQ
ncbi:ABC transporter ATP-binding protein [Oceanobacillus oncorhynchi]|uniref:ABC transporter ATP-binding protein n=1 Tax=Oceanobacillus oncorhynchi TaxID=545501 RepID=UPI002115E645|nr:ABC transporter ATP-binding protein [Oceanobacillus oncorhynchi]UUI39828.1 ABC transporter ATP-binding protein [Oceanobacillus oncorhynchi]